MAKNSYPQRPPELRNRRVMAKTASPSQRPPGKRNSQPWQRDGDCARACRPLRMGIAPDEHPLERRDYKEGTTVDSPTGTPSTLPVLTYASRGEPERGEQSSPARKTREGSTQNVTFLRSPIGVDSKGSRTEEKRPEQSGIRHGWAQAS
jgi:hypothetical protein